MLAVDMAVRISGRIDADEKGVQIIADTIKPLKVNYDTAKRIVIHIRPGFDTAEASNALKNYSSKQPGRYRSPFIYIGNGNALM